MADASDKIKNFKKAKGDEFAQDRKRKAANGHTQNGGDHKKSKMALPSNNPMAGYFDNKKFMNPNGKMDWNKVKSDTKSKKLHKKKKRLGGEEKFDAFTKATKLWESMRDDKCQRDQRIKLCAQLAQLFYGNVTAWLKNAGGGRMLQHIIEHGDVTIRARLFGEINKKDTILAFTKDVHHQKIVMRFLRHGTKEQRATILECFSGQIVKLTKHNIATHVIEFAFGEFSTAPQRSTMLQEFFGAMFTLFKEEDVRSLEDVLKKHPEQKTEIMAALQRGLQAMLHKGVLNNTLILSLMKEYMLFCDETERQTVVDSIQDGLLAVVHTRDGAHISQLCLWHGTAKQRKVILKSFRDHLMEVATTEHANTVLMAAIDCVDDTKFLAKAVLDPLMSQATKLVETDAGIKTFHYMVLGRNPTYFAPKLLTALEKGDVNPYSKKDKAVRRKEVMDAIVPSLVKELTENIEHQCRNRKWTLFLASVIEMLPTAALKKTLMEAIAKHAGFANPGDELVDSSFSHKMLCYIVKQDSTFKANNMPIFSLLLLKHAKKNLASWLNQNRGCFLALSMLETGIGRVIVSVREMIKENLEVVKKTAAAKSMGAKLLIEKLSTFDDAVATDVEGEDDDESEESEDSEDEMEVEEEEVENGEDEVDQETNSAEEDDESAGDEEDDESSGDEENDESGSEEDDESGSEEEDE